MFNLSGFESPMQEKVDTPVKYRRSVVKMFRFLLPCVVVGTAWSCILLYD